MANNNLDILQWSRQLTADDVQARREAVQRLLQAGTAAHEAAVTLLEAIDDQDEVVSVGAASALEDLGPPAVTMLKALVPFLGHANSDCGYWAATLLGRLGPAAAPAVPELAAAVRAHPAESVREQAAWALGHIGPTAKAAERALVEASRSASPRLARLATDALAQIGR